MSLGRIVGLLVSFLLCISSANCLTCDACDEQCGDLPNCVGGLVPDPCQCCYVCAKQAGETCGGPYDIHGQCDMGLACVITPDVGKLVTENEKGICKPVNDLASADICMNLLYDGCDVKDNDCDCRRIKACSNPHKFQSVHECQLYIAREEELERDCPKRGCAIQPSPTCPDDSTLREGYIPRGACCPLPSKCVCNPDSCGAQLCHPSTVRILTKTATNRPGSCCDVYACVPIDSDDVKCDDVNCPAPSGPQTCPDDSERIPAAEPPNKCCPPPYKCRCNKENCEVPKCPTGTRAHVSFRGDGKSGSCCDVYKCSNVPVVAGCSVNGTRHRHGTTYNREGCRTCDCRNGVSLCTPRPCPALPCSRQTQVLGECCPVCQDGKKSEFPFTPLYNPRPMCSSDDGLQLYDVGESWQVDNCTVCECVEGGKTRCNAAHCHEPIITITAPVCPSMTDCTLDCPHGYQVDDQNCRKCLCVKSLCPSFANCKINCPAGYRRDRDGCPVCECQSSIRTVEPSSCHNLDCSKQCPFGHRKQKNGCDRCRCKRCPALNTNRCEKDCQFGLRNDLFGCAVCECKDLPEATPKTGGKTCRDPEVGRKRDDGETWNSGCYSCMCRGGEVMCDLLQCPLLSCEKPVVVGNSCCPSCPGDSSVAPVSSPNHLSCHLPNVVLQEGQKMTSGPCVTCTCQGGSLLCSSAKCSASLPCEKPVMIRDSCCPVCPEDTEQDKQPAPSKNCRTPSGDVIKSERIWQRDICTNCVCENGKFRCIQKSCPVLEGCTHRVLRHGDCCAICLDLESTPPVFALRMSCLSENVIHPFGSSWKTAECETCTCTEVGLTCKELSCPIVDKCDGRLISSDDGCCVLCVPDDPDPEAEPGTFKPSQASLTKIAIGSGVLVILVVAGVFAAIYLRKRCARHTSHIKDFPDEQSNIPLKKPKHSRLNSSSKLLSTSSEYGEGKPSVV